MVLDHSRLGLENKFLENKSGPIFLRSTSLLDKILPTNLGVCKPTFYTFYISHLKWDSTMRGCFYHADLRQNAVFHNFSRLIIYTKKLLNSDWLRKECSSSVIRVQTCNAIAKLVTRVQITNGFWLAENRKETTKDQSDFSCFSNKI